MTKGAPREAGLWWGGIRLGGDPAEGGSDHQITQRARSKIEKIEKIGLPRSKRSPRSAPKIEQIEKIGLQQTAISESDQRFIRSLIAKSKVID